ncbi:hypothetical protein H5410_002176, partial [Solanum commersonii]
MYTTRLNLLMKGSIVYSNTQVVTNHYQRFSSSLYLLQMEVQAQQSSGIKCNSHIHKEEHYACFHPLVCPYFPIDNCFSSLKIKKVFSRLVIGLSVE